MIFTVLVFFLNFYISLLFPSWVRAVASDNYVWTEHAVGVAGYNITGLVVDSVGTTLYAATNGNGIYKSTDSGTNWSAVNTGLPSTKVISASNISADLLTMDPNNSSILYVNMNGKVYKTTNGGTSWALSNTGIEICAPNYQIAGILVDKTNSNHLFAGHIASGCGGGLYESTDQGANWSRVQTSGGANDMWPLAYDPSDLTKMYVSTVHTENYRSTNSGAAWTNMSFPASHSSYDGTVVAVHPTNHNVFIGDSGGGMVISSDYGATWADVASISGNSITAIKFAPSDATIAYALTAGGKIYKSTNSGSTWSLISTNASIVWSSLAIHPTTATTIFLGSRGGGMYKSIDSGTTVTQINTGIPVSTNVNSIAQAPSLKSLYYATVSGIGVFKSTDNAYSWTQVSSDTAVAGALAIAVDQTDPTVLFASGSKVYKSTDSGATWSAILSPAGGVFRSLAIDPNNHLIIFAPDCSTNNQIYKSTDGGSTWTAKATITSAQVCERVRVDPNNSSKVYLASYNYLWKSTDAGETWSQITSGLSGASDNWIDDIAVDPTNGSIVYLSTRGIHVYKSTDSGANWTATSFTAANSPHRIIIDPNNHNSIYAFTLYSIHVSTNAGTNWSAVTTSGLTSAFFNFKFTSLIDSSSSTIRIVGGDFYRGPVIYENYIPKFDQSTFSVANHNGSSSYQSGGLLDFTFTLKNTGPSTATNPKVKIVLPTPGISYVANSTTVDSNIPSSDPISGNTLTVNTPNPALNDSYVISFQARIDSSTTGNVVIDPTVTSNEDTLGTSIASLSISVNSSLSSSSGGSTQCSGAKPASPPDLFQINTSNTESTLYFTPSRNPYTGYFIIYSRLPTIDQHAAFFSIVNWNGVTKFTVKLLSPNTTYYFKVLPVNGCVPGPISNILRVKTTDNPKSKRIFYRYTAINYFTKTFLPLN